MNAHPRRAFLGVLVLGGATLVHRYGTPLPPPRTLDADTSVERVLMATLWRVVLPKGAPTHSIAAAERALDEVARLEAVLSEFRASSEIAQINQHAGVRSVPVSVDTWTVVERSLDWSLRSHGAFDPTWATLRSLWNFRTATPRPPTAEQLAERRRLIDWTAVTMNTADRSIRLQREGMALGLGGIAKGYALDRARTVLHDAGVQNFLLYAGGQVLASGLRDGRLWRVGIQHPRDPGALIATASLSNGSVSTGGDYEHCFEFEGRRYHHILDPRTGMPVSHTVSLTVITASALEADALDTVLFVLPPEEALRFANEHAIAALHLDAALTPTATHAMHHYLEMRPQRRS